MSHLNNAQILEKHDAWKGKRVTFSDPIKMRDGTCIGVFNGSYATLVLIDADAEGDQPRQIIDCDLDYVQLLEDPA